MLSPSVLFRAVFLAAVISATAACSASPSQPNAALTRFPVGIYGVTDPSQLARLKKDGFDTFHTYSSDPVLLHRLAAEAQRHEMKMVAYPNKVQEQDLSVTKNWPMAAWYLVDEPDVVKMSSTALQALADRTRSWDPERPLTFVIGQGAPASKYGGSGDVIMMDWYPVPHRPMETVADQIDLARRALPADKPFWMVVQAYDWADEVKDPEKLKGLRFPDHAEIRFMSYLSVVHGATGLFYFTLTKKEKTLFEYPELWQAVARVAREVRAIRPIFERGTRVALPFPPDPDGPEARAWHYRGREYVVILNRKGGAYQKMPEELLADRWRPLFEARRDPKELLKSMKGAHYLRPYQVMVLESRLRLFR